MASTFLSTLSTLLLVVAAEAQAQTYSYKSRPDLTPLIFNVTHELTEMYNPGYYLVCPYGSGVAQPSPAIYTSTGELVWSGAPEFGQCFDLKVQNSNGEDVLTFSKFGTMNTGQTEQTQAQVGHTEHDRGIILNSTYDVIANMTTSTPTGKDLHEFTITAPNNNTAMLTSYFPVETDLTAVGGTSSGWIFDCAFQEIDIASGDVLFSWNASAHVDVADSFWPFAGGTNADNAWDFFHMNSAIKDSEGNYLVNSRHLHSVYKIDGKTGAVMWTLGGKKSDFTLGDGAAFNWEHYVRWIEEGSVLSLFDNEGGGFPGSAGDHARGLILDIDVVQKTAALRQEYLPPVHATSPSQGSAQLQSDGNMLVGWGANPWLSEYSIDGTLIYAAALGGPMTVVDNSPIQNYRAFKTFTWAGRPRTTPDLVVDDTSVFVSWNGATEVATWEVLAGSTPDELITTTKGPKTGFETAFVLTSIPAVVQVRAYDGNNTLLAVSSVVTV